MIPDAQEPGSSPVKIERPGGRLASRPLHFIFIADCSGSMEGEKIRALNRAIHETLPHMRDAAEDNPNADLLVRAVAFSDGARWHVTDPTPVADFRWSDLEADGVTEMGAALSLVAEQLEIPPMSERALPPVLLLLSDGQPTDDFQKGLDRLMALPWGKRAVRLAVAIGDADLDVLQRFIGRNEITPLVARNPEALTRYIQWATTEVVKEASAPASAGTDTETDVPSFRAPAPPAVEDDPVW
jgi:uncharacterized protein YegL